MSKKKGSDRCTGHCCRSVSISMSPEELKAMYELPKGDSKREKDIDRLYEMLIYLGDFPSNPLLKLWTETWGEKALRLGTTDTWRAKAHGPQHFYGCRHIQLNGDCGIYDDRPTMCRRYPNGSLCDFEDCTMSVKDQVDQLEPGPYYRLERALHTIKERGLIPPSSLVRKVRENKKAHEKVTGGRHVLKAESVDLSEARPSMKLRVLNRG